MLLQPAKLVTCRTKVATCAEKKRKELINLVSAAEKGSGDAWHPNIRIDY